MFRILVELLLTWLVIWGAVFAIPMIVDSAIHPSNISEVSGGEPILKLAVASAGQQLWIQRGSSEIVSMDLSSRTTQSFYHRKGRQILYWNVSKDGGTCLFSVDDREISIVRNEELLASEQLLGIGPLITALSSNGKTAIRVSGGTSVRCWNLANDDPVESDFMLSEVAERIALDASGHQLAVSAGRQGLLIYDAKNGIRRRKLMESNFTSKEPVFSEDGSWLMVARGVEIVLLNVHSGETAWTIKTSDRDFVVSMAFSPDGKWIAASGVTTGIQFFDRSNGKLQRQLPPTTSLHRIAFAPSNDALYSGGADGSVTTWSLATGRQTQILKLLEEGR